MYSKASASLIPSILPCSAASLNCLKQYIFKNLSRLLTASLLLTQIFKNLKLFALSFAILFILLYSIRPHDKVLLEKFDAPPSPL